MCTVIVLKYYPKANWLVKEIIIYLNTAKWLPAIPVLKEYQITF